MILELAPPPRQPSLGAGALFLDRDGTLILDKHYLADPAGVELVPEAAASLRRARELGYHLFIHTNQSGIAKGLLTLDDVLRCNVRMDELLGLPAPIFDAICIAPEGPDDPPLYRKPSPRFILEMMARYSLNPDLCWMVGDRESDVEAGLNAGIGAAAVCTGKYDSAAWATRLRPGVALFPSIRELVATIPSAWTTSHA